ncbi:MAG: hypothetical protein A2499_01260 [Stygiobacter sp. RIFOXYC12_FULL_38_8]|nr:MAG: hypothetical protein A2299_00875 [Stygiobacter sp. RIFOXYB2_FULL_37_11]OGV16768.1 MAG: hypothetical protein A2440_05345 [Stygiobacter sp. RIFOXYC2_FULL_38_25]OGV18125.1 MAG: hypothetical protein A2237_06320 [Stygiobacter sp. RIFOXYA2_FULL_38_8]OGV29443.1 MAG: hypothetical protein A2499_01260 [Stygiobacter sp. RIFOXYC12_FULL_38_8]OGV82881.1 MAG: hypothetical protein A2X65_12810 [Stygiobacter sp. GWF2_38_21]RJQ61664.1 MAG: fibronectin type III domain-containing protein [Stygiobacter sp.]
MKNIKFLILIGLIGLISCVDEVTLTEENVHDPKSSIYTPNEPSSLKVDSYTDELVKLSWKDNSAGEDGFVIRRSLNDDSHYFDVGRVSESINTFSDTSKLEANKTYYYKVLGYKGDNYSYKSNEVTVNFSFVAPSNLSVTHINNTALKLNWSHNRTDIKGFKIYGRSVTNNENFGLIGDASNLSRSFDVVGLDSTNVYEFYCQAYTKNNISDASTKLKVLLGKDLIEKKTLNRGMEYFSQSSAGDILFSGGSHLTNGLVEIYTKDLLLKSSFQYKDPVTAISNNNEYLILGSSLINPITKLTQIAIVNISSKEIIDTIDIPASQVAFFNNDAQVLINVAGTASKYSGMILYDIVKHRAVWQNPTVKASKFYLDKAKNLLYALTQPQITVINPNSGDIIKNIIGITSGTITDFSIKHDGTKIALLIDKAIEIWDLNSNTNLRTININIGMSTTYLAYSLSFINDDNLIADSRNIYRISDREALCSNPRSYTKLYYNNLTGRMILGYNRTSLIEGDLVNRWKPTIIVD